VKVAQSDGDGEHVQGCPYAYPTATLTSNGQHTHTDPENKTLVLQLSFGLKETLYREQTSRKPDNENETIYFLGHGATRSNLTPKNT
jgi:hypothetical protein